MISKSPSQKSITIGARAAAVPVAYAYQDFGTLPIDVAVPMTTSKPWGTTHAV